MPFAQRQCSFDACGHKSIGPEDPPTKYFVASQAHVAFAASRLAGSAGPENFRQDAANQHPATAYRDRIKPDRAARSLAPRP
jgi:hypothetical protein